MEYLGPAARLAFALSRGRGADHRVRARSVWRTPMAIMVGPGEAHRAGVLVKNAEALERLESVNTLVVDKTGTLTEGKTDGAEAWWRWAATRRTKCCAGGSV